MFECHFSIALYLWVGVFGAIQSTKNELVHKNATPIIMCFVNIQPMFCVCYAAQLLLPANNTF